MFVLSIMAMVLLKVALYTVFQNQPAPFSVKS